MFKALSINTLLILVLMLSVFRVSAQQSVIVRDWSCDTRVGRFGYWTVHDYGESPLSRDHYFFFGPLGFFTAGSSGFILRPKPLVGIIAVSGVLVGTFIGFLRRKKYGPEPGEPEAAPNGGPAASVDNSNAPGGPPSVS